MKDEISFRSLIVKTSGDVHEQNQNEKNRNNHIEYQQENAVNFFLNKQKSSSSNISNNNNNSLTIIESKNDSKKSKANIKVKEYFNKNKQLNKNDFNPYMKMCGLFLYLYIKTQ